VAELPSWNDRAGSRQFQYQPVCQTISVPWLPLHLHCQGLGPTAGVLSGWALLFGYMLTGMSTLCGFGIIAGVLLGQIGIHAHILALFAIGTILAFYIAYRDIQLSAKTMLAFEEPRFLRF